MASTFSAAMAAVFTAETAEDTAETAVTKTAARSLKFSSHHSKMYFSVGLDIIRSVTIILQ